MNHFVNSDWKSFPAFFHKTYKVLDVDKDLSDVTLVCDDGAVDAHKLILSTASMFFRTLLKKSQHGQPLIYLKGVRLTQLQKILDFIYYGQVIIAQDDLKEFIETAQDFEIKGIDNRSEPKIAIANPNKESTEEIFVIDAIEQETTVETIVPMSFAQDNLKEFINTDMYVEIESIKHGTKKARIDEVKSAEKSDDRTLVQLENKGLVEGESAFVKPIKELKEEIIIIDEEIPIDTTEKEISSPETQKHFKSENGEGVYKVNESKEKPEKEDRKMRLKNTIIKVGQTFASISEVKEAVECLSDATYCRFVCSSNCVENKTTIPKRRIKYDCSFGGRVKKSTSKGIRQCSSKYVGCPAFLQFNQLDDGRFLVIRGDLEHKEHEVSEKAYAKVKRKLTTDQEEAVKALLETDPSYAEIAEFLSDLTGKHYAKREARHIKIRLVGKLK